MEPAFSNSLTASATPSATAPKPQEAMPQDKAPKFVRSKDRCHMMTRTPIYDQRGALLAYNFRYTAGEESFTPDVLERKHVKHVIIGFYIRRHIDQFAGESGTAMAELPLTQEVTKFSKPMPANHFILHLQDKQESAASFQHQVNMLKRDTMSIAADVYTIVYTNWFTELRSISYAVIDMTMDVEEQFILARDIVKKAPWIKIICDRCDTQNLAAIAFEAGANYVCCPTFPKDILKANFNPYRYKTGRSTYDDVSTVIKELLENRPDYMQFVDLVSMRPDIKAQIPMILEFLQKDMNVEYVYTDLESSLYDIDTETLHKLIGIIAMMLLEEFYKADTEKNKYFKYEPLKQVLLRAKFIEEILAYKAGEVDISWAFSVGLSASLNLMYAYTTQKVEANIKAINSRLMVIYQEQPLIETAVKIALSMEKLDLPYVKGVMEAKTFGRHDILFAYENAIIWTSNLFELMTNQAVRNLYSNI